MIWTYLTTIIIYLKNKFPEKSGCLINTDIYLVYLTMHAC